MKVTVDFDNGKQGMFTIDENTRFTLERAMLAVNTILQEMIKKALDETKSYVEE